jgi:hypothetical protein
VGYCFPSKLRKLQSWHRFYSESLRENSQKCQCNFIFNQIRRSVARHCVQNVINGFTFHRNYKILGSLVN